MINHLRDSLSAEELAARREILGEQVAMSVADCDSLSPKERRAAEARTIRSIAESVRQAEEEMEANAKATENQRYSG